MSLVYLAGPIAGMSYDQAVALRVAFAKAMPSDIKTLSPMRGKEFLSDAKNLDRGHGGPAHPLTTDAGITARDFNDVSRSDAIFFNLLGAKEISIGTSVEFGWAHALRKPTIVAMEARENPHDHPMIRRLIDFRAYSLEEGIRTTIAVLSAGV